MKGLLLGDADGGQDLDSHLKSLRSLLVTFLGDSPQYLITKNSHGLSDDVTPYLSFVLADFMWAGSWLGLSLYFASSA